MTRPSASTRSAVRCGRAVCPPGEVSEISTTSHAEVIGPTRVPSFPTSSRGSQCSAKIRSTPSMAPSATMSIAPPGCTSSAGWKTSRTRPGSVGALASASPAPSSIAVCASWPQACITFGVAEANGSPVDSCSGRASMSARRATQRLPRPTSHTRPVPPGRVRGSRPAAVSRRPIRAVVRCSARPSSGAACSARRQETTSDRCSASHESSHAGPLPAPMSTTAGPVAGTTAVSFSRTVTGPHRPSTLRGASAHTPHPDGGVPSRYDLLAGMLAEGLPICCGRAHDT